MSADNQKLKRIAYEIEFSFVIPGFQDEFKTIDVNSFYVVRTPFYKTASFSIITLEIPIDIFNALNNEIRSNRFTLSKMKLSLVDPNKKDPDDIRKKEPTDFILSRDYKIVSANPVERLEAKNINPIVKLTLVNPILHYLDANNTVNKLYEDVSAFDSIKQFISEISKKYGKNKDTILFKDIIKEDQINDFKYEQILCKSKNDLLIPWFISQNYKISYTFTYTFFDDFDISKDSSSIVFYLVNLFDQDLFEQKDIYLPEYGDFQIENKMKNGPFPFSDKKMDPEMSINPFVIFKKSNNLFRYRKPKGKISIPSISTIKESVILKESRELDSMETNYSEKEDTNNKLFPIYVPDTIEKAKKRFESVYDQIINRIESVYEHEVNNVHIDMIQFKHSYNLEPGASSDFSFVPISIVNIFRKTDTKTTILSHTVRYQSVKFKNKEF